MKNFNIKPLVAVISGLAVFSTSQLLLAQSIEDTENPEVEELVVTGFARSIQNSIDTKRNADTVVQAISASDIGGLPDVSIADALGRVPGITVTRKGGQAGTVQVRGMGEGFVFSTLNGREQVSPNGSRAMEFSQFPSELIQSVEVYMSPKASLIEGGVAGTVELKTANPLDMTEDQKIQIGVRGSYNDQASDIYDAEPLGERFSVSFQKKLFDDTLGVALGYARLVQTKATTAIEQYNYEQTPLDVTDGMQLVNRDFQSVGGYRPSEVYIPDGFEIYQINGDETRDGYMGAIQFEPNESISIQADVFYSKFESESIERGFQVQPLNQSEVRSLILEEIDDYYYVVGGQFSGKVDAPTASTININSNDISKTSELLSGGVNVAWKQDALKLTVDLSHSEASGFDADSLARAHLYKQTDDLGSNPNGFERDGNQQVTYFVDGIDVPSLGMGRDYTDVNTLRMTSYERYPRINDDVIDAARFDFEYEIESNYIRSVEGGVRYSERNHKDRRKVFVYGDGGNGTITEDYSLPITSSTSDVVNWKGEFSHFPSFLAFDADEIIESATNMGLVKMSPYEFNTWDDPRGPTNQAAFDQYGNLLPRSTEPAARWGEGRSWSMTERSDIDENILSFYLQANIQTTLGGRDLVGNVGVRHVHTDQSTVGLINVFEGGEVICDEVGVCIDNFAEATAGKKYNDILPSLNLNYSLTDSDQLRVAVARLLSRPPINRLAAPKNTGQIEVQGQIAKYNYGANSSPELTPFIADQIDISYEHYMDDVNGSFVAAIYHREVKSFIQDILIRNYDFIGRGYPVPSTYLVSQGGLDVELPVVNGDFSTSINNKEGGYIRGLELSYTQTFNELPDLFAGLGVSGSFSLTDSEITVLGSSETGGAAAGKPLPFPGLVEKSGNLTVFYSYENFETRLSTTFQDSFVGEERAIDLTPIEYAPELVMDYQASYKFDSGLDLVFSISNLTNEPNRSYILDEELTRKLQWFGRTYYAGINYTF